MLDDDACLRPPTSADAAVAQGDDVGPLHGLPTAFKDTEPAVGFPYTRDHHLPGLPAAGRLGADRAVAAGRRGADRQDERARVRHGLAHVQRRLRHHPQPVRPVDERGRIERWRRRRARCGLLPIADGSDYGGSLRNPANFNNVVALRPTVGLVPGAGRRRCRSSATS